jgi:hypothetical protein
MTMVVKVTVTMTVMVKVMMTMMVKAMRTMEIMEVVVAVMMMTGDEYRPCIVQ